MGFFFMHRASPHAQVCSKKTQGKNHVMQRHEQILPPCRCIAQIEAGE
jgi:hypothetical protein